MEESTTEDEESLNPRTLSTDPETLGLDVFAGQTWYYPINFPLRDYQYNIIKEALFKNTLVCLPTGLGKTFIAAVIMYNFYRWYPASKMIFMAPTKPLVKQQIDACCDIMGIPRNTIIELTGANAVCLRGDLWKNKRIFFITPQILRNDLDTVKQLSNGIRCVVIDEAHRAKGNHAYCQVIQKLSASDCLFRVLALTATPGSTINDVREVIKNLLISHLELKDEENPDVAKYTFTRTLEEIVVPLGDMITKVRNAFIMVLEEYTRPLVESKILPGNVANLTKGRIVMITKAYKENINGPSKYSTTYTITTRNLSICMSLYHGFELLIRHGLRSFLTFFEGDYGSKPLLKSCTRLTNIITEVRELMGPDACIDPLPDGTYQEIPPDYKFGHPKFYKLRSILLKHFTADGNENSRVIVFCEFRESVKEVFAILLQSRPTIRPKIFLGQGVISQKQQLMVIGQFREGVCNTLVSSCIGEEGLDVGEVDLIVCFDISSKSPIRMVQRMGRTGRKREGKVIVLVTEGKEKTTLADCLNTKNNLNIRISRSTEVFDALYKSSPRLIPMDLNPSCRKIYITKQPEIEETVKKGKRLVQKSLVNSLMNTQQIRKMPVKPKMNAIPEAVCLWNMNKKDALEFEQGGKINYARFIEKQRALQETGQVGHSSLSHHLVDLLKFSDSKRFCVPITQEPVEFAVPMAEPAKRAKKPVKNITVQHYDIRDMFSRENQDHLSQVQKTKKILKRLLDLRLDYFSAELEHCILCESSVNCQFLGCEPTPKASDTIKYCPVPNLSILESITAESLNLFAASMTRNKVICTEESPPEKCSGPKTDAELTLKYFGLYKPGVSSKEMLLDIFVCDSATVIADRPKSPQKSDLNDSFTDMFLDESPPMFVDSPKKPDNTEELLNSSLDVFADLSPIEPKAAKRAKTDGNSDDRIPGFFKAPPETAELSIIENSPILNRTQIRRKCSSPIVDEGSPVPTKNQAYESPAKVSETTAGDESPILTVSNRMQAIIKSKVQKKLFSQKPNSPNETRYDSIFDLSTEDIFASLNDENNSNDCGSNKKGRFDLWDEEDFYLAETLSKPSRSFAKPAEKSGSSSNKKSTTSPCSEPTTSNLESVPSIDLTGSSQKSRLEPVFINSEDDFDFTNRKPSTDGSSPLKNVKRVKKTKKKSKACNFIDLEAEVSGETVSSDSSSEEDDSLDSSFIHDSIVGDSPVSMKLKYLDSVKSPMQNRGFKIPDLPPLRDDIFSQVEPRLEENTYVHDSFCVENDIDLTQDTSLTELEEAERRLKQRRKDKRKRPSDSIERQGKVKRKRIIVLSDSD